MDHGKKNRSSCKSYLPDDMIVTEILLQLPLKSLFRFKCTSKGWQSNISDPSFARTYISKHKSCESIGFLYQRPTHPPKELNFFPFSKEGKKFLDNNPTFIEFLSSSKLRIQDSSEGLLLCTPHNYGKHEEYHLWDPINGLRLKLPKPKYQLIDRTFVIAKLICDPLSSSYRVVCLFSQLARRNLPTNMIHIETYFSDAKEWRVSHHHSTSPIGLIFPSEHNYVSLKGASHWMDLSGNIVMYNPDKDNLRVLKSPILPLQPGGGCHLFSLGVSEDGCLRCSTTHRSLIRVWILEDENLNRWSLRYQISIKIPWELDTYFFPYELFMLEAKIILQACTGEMLCYHLKSEALEPIEFQYISKSKLYSFVAPTWPLLAP